MPFYDRVYEVTAKTKRGFVMYAIIALVLIGSWFIGNMAGHDRYAQILGTEPGALEMIMGLSAPLSVVIYSYILLRRDD